MFLQNPVPILKQRKSEMNTNPLIIGDNEEENIPITFKRREILIDINREFTDTIDDICYELMTERKVKMNRRKIKWLTIILSIIVVIYLLIDNKL